MSRIVTGAGLSGVAVGCSVGYDADEIPGRVVCRTWLVDAGTLPRHDLTARESAMFARAESTDGLEQIEILRGRS